MTPLTNSQSLDPIFRSKSHLISPVKQSTPLEMSLDSSAWNNSILGSSDNTRRPSVKFMFPIVDEDVGSNSNVNVDVNNIGRYGKSSSRCSGRKRKGSTSSRRRSSGSSRSSVKEEEQACTLSGLVDGALTKITDVLFDNLGCDAACSGWMNANTPSTCTIFDDGCQ